MIILNKDRLKECRLNLGITKQEAARRIEISQPAYLRYEAGTRTPSIQVISKMAEVFSTSIDYLIGKTSESSPDRTVIEKEKNPSLFLLAEACKELNDSQLKHLLSYANELSKIESGDYKSK